MKSIKLGLIAIAMVTVLSACSNQDAGTVVGATAGGLLGNTIGGGNGNTVATIGGAAAGAYVGNRVGRNMDGN